jgi:hypothetical protein
MDTTLTSTVRVPYKAQQSTSGLLRTAASALGRMRTAIVAGPSGACWQPVDAATSFSMLPSSERARLLDSGNAPTAR